MVGHIDRGGTTGEVLSPSAGTQEVGWAVGAGSVEAL